METTSSYMVKNQVQVQNFSKGSRSRENETSVGIGGSSGQYPNITEITLCSSCPPISLSLAPDVGDRTLRAYDIQPDVATVKLHLQSDLVLLQSLKKYALDLEGHQKTVQDVVEEVERRVSRRRNLIAPIRKLPMEVLQLIFKFCCGITVDDEGELQFPITLGGPSRSDIGPDALSAVCHWWRIASQSLPIIWTSVCIELESGCDLWNWEIATRILKNTKGHPLSVRIRSERQYQVEAPPVVVEMMARAAHLDLHLQCTVLNFNNLQFWAHPVRSLRISWLSHTVNSWVVRLFASALIETLDVPSVGFLRALAQESNAFQNVTSLRIGDAIQPSDLRNLSHLPNLRFLKTSFSTDLPHPGDDDNSDEGSIVFPRLQELQVTYDRYLSHTILPFISAPHLASFAYQLLDACDSQNLVNFLRRLDSPSSLRRLNIQGECSALVELQDCLPEIAAPVEILDVDLQLKNAPGYPYVEQIVLEFIKSFFIENNGRIPIPDLKKISFTISEARHDVRLTDSTICEITNVFLNLVEQRGANWGRALLRMKRIPEPLSHWRVDPGPEQTLSISGFSLSETIKRIRRIMDEKRVDIAIFLPISLEPSYYRPFSTEMDWQTAYSNALVVPFI